MTKRRTATRRAKDRGRGFEYRVARRLNGTRRILSKGGDVEARGMIGECKYRSTDEGLKLLMSWIRQAEKYSHDDPLGWFLAFTIGQRAPVYVLTTLENFDENTQHRIEATHEGSV